MNSAPRWIGIWAGILGFAGVALGAFGAHALKDTLIAHSSTDIWNKAVLYHLVHAVALLTIGRTTAGASPSVAWIARLWAAGIILFSGSLYALALGGPKFLGPITPLGGLALLTGWSLVTWSTIKSNPA